MRRQLGRTERIGRYLELLGIGERRGGDGGRRRRLERRPARVRRRARDARARRGGRVLGGVRAPARRGRERREERPREERRPPRRAGRAGAGCEGRLARASEIAGHGRYASTEAQENGWP